MHLRLSATFLDNRLLHPGIEVSFRNEINILREKGENIFNTAERIVQKLGKWQVKMETRKP